MRMIGAVSPASGGTLRVLGRDPRARRPRDPGSGSASSRRRTTSTSSSTVGENLLIYGRYFGLPRTVIRRAPPSCSSSCSSPTGRDRVDPLSGGMKRRLTIARALINEPELLLLDEPTTGLDPQARHVLWDRLYRLKQQGVTLVLTTHYMDEAEQLCDRLVIMDGGRIVAEGSPRELIEQHVDPRGRRDPVRPRQKAVADAAISATTSRCSRTVSCSASTTVRPSSKQVHERGLRPETVLVRRSTLEDVFLRLTGPEPGRVMPRRSRAGSRVVGWHAMSYRWIWRGLVTCFLNPIFFLASIGVAPRHLVDSSDPTSGA